MKFDTITERDNTLHSVAEMSKILEVLEVEYEFGRTRARTQESAYLPISALLQRYLSVCLLKPFFFSQDFHKRSVTTHFLRSRIILNQLVI